MEDQWLGIGLLFLMVGGLYLLLVDFPLP